MLFNILGLLLLFRATFAQTTPDCNTQEQLCMETYSSNLQQHGDNITHVCSGLKDFVACVNTITCRTEEYKKQIIQQGKMILSVPCPCFESQDQCLSTFVARVYPHANNQTLVCRDVSDYEKCLTGLNCLSQAEIKNLVNQTQQLVLKGTVCAAQPACDLEFQCLNTLSENFASHGEDQALVCRDTQAFISCINNINCKTETEKSLLIKQGRSLLGFPCPCLDGQDKCSSTFATAVYPHLNNQTLACRDVSDYEKCLTGLNCLSQTEIKNLVNKTQKLALGGIICETTTPSTASTTTTTPSTTTPSTTSTTAPATASTTRTTASTTATTATTKSPGTTTKSSGTACGTGPQLCQSKFVQAFMSHVTTPQLMCTDLKDVELCLRALGCLSETELRTILDQNKNQLIVGGVLCGADGNVTIVRNTPPPTTPSTLACSTKKNNCVANYVMTTLYDGYSNSLVCKALVVLAECMVNLDCLSVDVMQAELDSNYQDRKNGGYTCDYVTVPKKTITTTTIQVDKTTTPATLTTTAPSSLSCKVDTDTCSVTFQKSFFTHTSSPQLLCGDLSTFEGCLRSASCLSDPELKSLVGQRRQQVLGVGVNCGGVPISAAACQRLEETCLNKFILETYQVGYSNDLVCGALFTFAQCLVDMDCRSDQNITASIREQQQDLVTRNFKCANFSLPPRSLTLAPSTSSVATSVTTTPYYVNTALPNDDCTRSISACLSNYSNGVLLHDNNNSLICRDLTSLRTCLSAVNSSCINTTRIELLVDQSQLSLEMKGFTCGESKRSTTPAAPVNIQNPCKTGVQTCFNRFQTALINLNSVSLICDYTNVYLQCIFNLNGCGYSTTYRAAIIDQTRDQLKASNINCPFLSQDSGAKNVYYNSQQSSLMCSRSNLMIIAFGVLIKLISIL
ncbi:mucin-5AC-like [Physella acuta]|uniref:mucin-5AC-like n=1 Tax=Physella acuta TaxID=109671 RepID=UPI0027DB420D|nr:mucin-5AC-like [Physella acuta]